MKTNSSSIIIPPPARQTSTNGVSATDIRDIKAPLVIPSAWSWLWWTLGALAMMAAVGVILHRRFRRGVRPKAPEIVVPPDVRARNRLREALALIGQPQPFCTMVSDTLRVYLEERFRFHAPDRTTEEFLDELQSSPLLALSQKQVLGDFLTRCDLVKFARYEPGEPELRDLHDSALRLVDETAPPPLPSTSERRIDSSTPPVMSGGQPSVTT